MVVGSTAELGEEVLKHASDAVADPTIDLTLTSLQKGTDVNIDEMPSTAGPGQF